MKETGYHWTPGQAPAYPAGFGQNLAPKGDGSQPLFQFPGDINVAALATYQVPLKTLLGNRCVGFMIANVTAPVQVNINGGGYRTLYNDTAFDGCLIDNLTVYGGTGGCILQLLGV